MCKNIDLRRKENAARNSAHNTAGAMVCSYAKAALWGGIQVHRRSRTKNPARN